MTYTADDRSADEYRAAVQAAIDGGFWNAALSKVRGQPAAVVERTDASVAFVSWIEGGHLIEVYGFGDQGLQDLLGLVARMREPA